MVADEPFGLTLLDDVGATCAQLSYFKRFGGPPNGKGHFILTVFCRDRSLWEPLKEGTDTLPTNL